MACLVQGFKGHSPGHSAIPDNGHHMMTFSRNVASDSHTQCRRDRGAGMSGTKVVMSAFRPLGESADTSVLANGGEEFPAPGEQFMSVGLMAYIPYDLVSGTVKGPM